jgi:hypothetical protein
MYNRAQTEYFEVVTNTSDLGALLLTKLKKDSFFFVSSLALTDLRKGEGVVDVTIPLPILCRLFAADNAST